MLRGLTEDTGLGCAAAALSSACRRPDSLGELSLSELRERRSPRPELLPLDAALASPLASPPSGMPSGLPLRGGDEEDEDTAVTDTAVALAPLTPSPATAFAAAGDSPRRARPPRNGENEDPLASAPRLGCAVAFASDGLRLRPRLRLRGSSFLGEAAGAFFASFLGGMIPMTRRGSES